ncbi:MAG TPA: PQQ-dependent sugar dehydrogenase [Gemmatimonadaceae bacterium]|nr:PQQ-dependent sugar dehydrogenase [Gemmatimonadaceae bacterium]
MILRLLISVLVMLACGGSDESVANAANAPAIPETTLRLEKVAEGLHSPVYLTSPPGDDRLFVVEQAGRIRIIKNGRLLPTAFLDIASSVRSGGEQGMLSVAFHPDYKSNGWFFVNYTDRNGDTHVERFHVTSNPDVADPGSAKLILKIDQPYANHNGGLVIFGPDRMLYIGMGDGGSGGDPRGNGQNKNALLGKLLRINVSRAEPYTIPVGNPFADGSSGAREAWAIGMRNPWRFSFDRVSGMIYIGDVGQDRSEEIHVAPSNKPGLNYGWNIMEGSRCYRTPGCNRDGLEMPVLTYDHGGGVCSVIGGYVYRGHRIPKIVGHYFYSDYCAGWIRSFRHDHGQAVDRKQWNVEHLGSVTSFGEDSSGELYIVSDNGTIWRFAGVS